MGEQLVVNTALNITTKLLPKFNGKNPPLLCLKILPKIEVGTMPNVLLLQSVLEGKAQEVFISLSSVDQRDTIMKDAILKAYELVPEAYHFDLGDGERQTYVEVAQELTSHFNRCTSLGLDSFDSLCDLVNLEQFKDIIPERIVTYIIE